MLSRRSLVLSGALVAVSTPFTARAVTEMPPPAWPIILGSAVDSQRTRFVPGSGIGKAPGELIQAASELAFLQERDHSPVMAMTNGVLVARAMGPQFPLVGVDASTGEELWRRGRVDRILGARRKQVVFTTAPRSEDAFPLLKSGAIDRVSDNWAVTVGEVIGGSVLDNTALIYSQWHDEKGTLICRRLDNGAPIWLIDLDVPRESVPNVFAAYGDVVVGVSESGSHIREIYAWRLTDGELLWRLEDRPYLTTPVFRGDQLIVATRGGLHIIDAETGERVHTIRDPELVEERSRLAVTKDAAVLTSSSAILSVSWESGEVNWRRSPVQSTTRSEMLVCDGVLYRLENATASLGGVVAVRGYDLEDGRLHLEYVPTDENEKELDISSFLVANGHLLLATNRGVCTVMPGDEELTSLRDPALDGEFINEEFGFSYSWDEEWEAIGSTFMTPNGQVFQHGSTNRFVAQSAGETRDSDSDFTRSWHAVLGPDDSQILEIHPVEPPKLDFIPESAEVLGVVYRTKLPPPVELCFGVRVLVPLEGGNRLLFDYFQLEVRYEGRIDSFATFFDNLRTD